MKIKWTVVKRFLKLPPLQRGSLVRRRRPAWLRPKPATLADLNFRPSPAGRAGAPPGEEDVALCCVPHPSAGIGHRFSEWNTGLIVARKAGLPFLNAGLGGKWDDEFGFTGNFANAAAYLKRRSPSVVRLPLIEWHDRPEAADELAALAREVAAKKRNTVAMLADGQNLFRQHDSARELQALYQRRPGGPAETAPREKLRIAVHVRRGDVARMKQTGERNWEARFVETGWFVAVLSAVVGGIGGRPREIEVFSQGDAGNFKEFGAFDSASLCLDADPAWTVHRTGHRGRADSQPELVFIQRGPDQPRHQAGPLPVVARDSAGGGGMVLRVRPGPGRRPHRRVHRTGTRETRAIIPASILRTNGPPQAGPRRSPRLRYKKSSKTI